MIGTLKNGKYVCACDILENLGDPAGLLAPYSRSEWLLGSMPRTTPPPEARGRGKPTRRERRARRSRPGWWAWTWQVWFPPTPRHRSRNRPQPKRVREKWLKWSTFIGWKSRWGGRRDAHEDDTVDFYVRGDVVGSIDRVGCVWLATVVKGCGITKVGVRRRRCDAKALVEAHVARLV